MYVKGRLKKRNEPHKGKNIVKRRGVGGVGETGAIEDVEGAAGGLTSVDHYW